MKSDHLVGKRSNEKSRTSRIRRAAIHFILLGLLWLVLTQGDTSSWVIGLPTVLFATLVSLRFSAASDWGWRWRGTLRFLPFFFYCSLKGGIDVASRAFQPALPLAPAMTDYSLRLREGTARVFFANVVSLLPGTLSADISGDTLIVHVLDRNLPTSGQLRRLELAVARLFGCPVGSDHPGETETSAP